MKEIQIKSIKKINKSKVYDIEVKDAHHYILDNGVISHNSMSFMGGNVIAGGGGPAYNSSVTLTFTKAQEKGTDGSITGGLISSTTTKCRTAKEKTKVKFSIDFESGLNKYSGLELFCKEEKLIEGDKRGWKFAKKTNFMQDQEKIKLEPAIWDEFIKCYLADYLHDTFAYNSLHDDLLGDDDNE